MDGGGGVVDVGHVMVADGGVEVEGVVSIGVGAVVCVGGGEGGAGFEAGSGR